MCAMYVRQRPPCDWDFAFEFSEHDEQWYLELVNVLFSRESMDALAQVLSKTSPEQHGSFPEELDAILPRAEVAANSIEGLSAEAATRQRAEVIEFVDGLPPGVQRELQSLFHYTVANGIQVTVGLFLDDTIFGARVVAPNVRQRPGSSMPVILQINPTHLRIVGDKSVPFGVARITE